MRKQIWITGIIFLAICCALLLWHHGPEPKKAVPLESEIKAETNQADNVSQSERLATQQNTSAPTPSSITMDMRVRRITTEESNAAYQKIVRVWQTPIDFYGKVVDENRNPVPGAAIEFTWMELPTEDGSRYTNTQSDVNGLFSLQGQHGPTVQIQISKDGYYPRRGGARYGPGDTPEFSADPKNPVVFLLRKKARGVELITSENGMRPNVAIRIPKDDAPVYVDLLEKKASATGQLEISQNKPPLQFATNWSFKMSISGGGLLENQDEFQFEAPETNYQRMIEYAFAKNETNWTTQVNKQFYIKFGEPPKYGWLRIESNLAQETVFLTYAINPTGSRNLEPLEAKPFAPTPPPWAPPGARAVIPEFK